MPPGRVVGPEAGCPERVEVAEGAELAGSDEGLLVGPLEAGALVDASAAGLASCAQAAT